MRIYLIYLFILIALFSKAQTSIQINEVCSRNTNVVADEDLDYEDWIEIYNKDTIAVNLSQYYLSDDNDEPLMWQFPELFLQPNDYLLVFASGKNRKAIINHWETALSGDSLWRYINPTDDNQTEYDYVYWSDADYDDSDWQEDYGSFGDSISGYEQVNTYVTDSLRCLYLRQEFYVSDTSKILSAVLHAYYDDGFTAYLNGYEIMRVNMIHDGIKPSHNKTAFRQHLSRIDTEEPPEAFIIETELLRNLLKNGRNVLAIQNNNFWKQYPKVIKTWLSFASSDSTYQFDTISNHLYTQDLPLHSNFKINGNGEKIYLFDKLGQELQEFNTPALSINTSAGLHPDFADSMVLYETPSPRERNASFAKESSIKDSIILAYLSGYYSDSIKVEVLSPIHEFMIKYTNDGSLPRDTSFIYDTAFYADSSTVFRFRYFADSLISGPISNYTYLINDSSSFDFFSIITDPYNLWDNDYGIYVKGSHYYPNPPYFEANFWQNWERPVHIQHFSSEGDLYWKQDAGIKIHGNYTRMIPQKSFGFYAKSEYGYSKFEHLFSDQKPAMESRKRFLLRNAGNDYYYAHLRDLLVQTRMQNENLDIQSGKPINAYLNGQYWGIYHLREKIDRFYIQDNWGVNPDSVDILEQNGLIISGNRNEFEDLLRFVKNNDLSINSNYEYVANEIEIDNWINNLISNLYHFNTDWPHHNTKFWKSDSHKWRQILVDQDVVMAYKYDNEADDNSLMRMHDDTISYLAVFYQELLHNQNFKRQYTNRFADLMNTIFLEDQYIALMDSLVNVMAQEMERHTERWNRNLDFWENLFMPRIRSFISNRSPHMRNHLRHLYNLGANDTITLSVLSNEEGRIKLNSIFIDEDNWSGLYFDSVPINLEAIPNPGYVFTGWESPTSPQLADSNRIIRQWFLKSHDTIIAHFFSPSGGGDTLQISFTEINYRSFSNAEAGDWLEIVNKETDSIDLSHWSLKGQKPYEIWNIPAGVKIGPQERLVIVQDTNLFKNAHTETHRFIGPFNFGISSNEETISLWDELGRRVNKMSFTSETPWPNNNNTSKTIELIDIELDYHLAGNWSLGCPGGSPGLTPQNCEKEYGLVFTEINYKSIEKCNSGDWLEMLNNSDSSISLSHWIFKDSNPNNAYIFPEGTKIEAHDKLIIIEDTALYFSVHDRNEKVYGPTNFGLSASGENISLSNQFEQQIIEITYSDVEPWPEGASGTGFTIELEDENLDMQNGENWITNCFLGTPFHSVDWCIQANSIIISEVKYQSSPEYETGDWIELFNTNNRAVNLYDWKLIHKGDTLNIDTNYLLPEQSYITLIADSALFYQVYDSTVSSILLDSFNLQREEDAIFILNPYLQPGNILFYHHLLNWPVFQTDTNNRTLELISYQNTIIPENWRAGCEYGTPNLDPSFCDTEGLHSINSSNYQLLVHPNPISTLLNVEFHLPQSEFIEIIILDAQSNIVKQENLGLLTSGKHIININLQRLPTGIYFLQLRGENSVDHQKIIKIK